MAASPAYILQWILAFLVIISSVGVIVSKKPVYASLSFLVTLLTLATFYLQLSAEFTAIMQVIVYAGAILVIFMFVMILFQDAHHQIEKWPRKTRSSLVWTSALVFVLTMGMTLFYLLDLPPLSTQMPQEFGTAHSLGHSLYLEFFFPFELMVLLFLVALVGALYIAKKEPGHG